jgi:hypothetical protein
MWRYSADVKSAADSSNSSANNSNSASSANSNNIDKSVSGTDMPAITLPFSSMVSSVCHLSSNTNMLAVGFNSGHFCILGPSF